MTFEEEWRELLMKRLESARAVLKRDATAEIKLLSQQAEIERKYATPQEAQDAFGWGYITETEYRKILWLFERNPAEGSASQKALTRLGQIISTLKGEIVQLRGEGVQEQQIQRYFEQKEAEA